MNSIISSVIASTVVAAIISSLVSYRLKNLEFRNEYYKIIIQKRLDSYASIERIVLLLQTVIIEEDYSKYHEIFSSWSSVDEFRSDLRIAKYKGLWIVESTLNIINEVENLFIKLDNNFSMYRNDDSIMAGENYFLELEKLKKQLEAACRYDILHLHKIT
jgi:hypothetical protein